MDLLNKKDTREYLNWCQKWLLDVKCYSVDLIGLLSFNADKVIYGN